jgi:hypothetical protein
MLLCFILYSSGDAQICEVLLDTGAINRFIEFALKREVQINSSVSNLQVIFCLF